MPKKKEITAKPTKDKIYNEISKIGYQTRSKDSFRATIPKNIAELFHITGDDYIQWRAIYDFEAKEWKLMANIINVNEIRKDVES
ncbi:hypothetical protein [Methanosphaera cuniculi]|uniref:Uncharacterized protein n=1 Tax=Methanosphaera cuniculi TaxID=1077256 RepID=A0A2A2HE58_9EURY|nr:hypothetical protein [Methanosphaera cuniculi]PAV07523.1 hypothetical protein ASJ82_07555 [Methanosphaera cuniculi]PWL08161.1 hypothetical protein MSCUN_10920 [Methanosphaera cuniculi]